MFSIEWTTREPKPQAEIDELYSELLESIEIDGPYEFATLYCAAGLLETRYTLARVIGFTEPAITLSDTDIVDFFVSTDAALEALEAHRAGVLEFYVASAAVVIVFDATEAEQVQLFLVPWEEAIGIDLKESLPQGVTAYPSTTCTHEDLIDHLKNLRHEFASAAIKNDPRLADHEPLRRWSRNEHGRVQDA